jgi:DNA polymerase elongation subunit (family B)
MNFYASSNIYKNQLLVTRYEDKKRIVERVQYEPYLFVPASNGAYQTIFGDKRERKDFNSIRDAKEFIARYKDVKNFQFDGISNWPYLYIYDTYKQLNQQYDESTLSIVGIDIETAMEGGWSSPEEALNEVTAITISRNDKYVCLGLKDFDPSLTPYDCRYIKCKTERELLAKFLVLWNSPEFSPDIITGWYIEGYDVPYLINRITNVMGFEAAQRLSPHGVINSREVDFSRGRKSTVWTILGVAVLDYLHLYTKFIIPNKGQPESKSLNYICEEELGEKKLDYSEYGDLDTLYRENPQKYHEYNVRDVFLVDKLEKKLKLISLAILMTYDAGVNFTDVFGTVKVWDMIIHEYLMKRQMVVPFANSCDEDFRIEGGHVKDPKPGLFEWVVSVDLKSSYPHQIMQYNIGPETFVDRIPTKANEFVAGTMDMFRLTDNGKYCVAGNGCRFTKDKKSFWSALMEENFNKRAAYKRKMIEAEVALQNKELTKEDRTILEHTKSKYENMQFSAKIKINAFYGSLSNAYSRWFNPHFGEAITQSGQLAVKWGEKVVNKYLNETLKTDTDYIIAIDTDSLYMNLGPLVYKIDPSASATSVQVPKICSMLDKFCDAKLLPVIRAGFDDLAVYMNAYAQKMDMNREVIANKSIWTGKKHYILNMMDKEGIRYDPPKMKIVGIEAVRSSTPGAARKAIKDCLAIIMNGTEVQLQQAVRDIQLQFNELPLDEIAFPRSSSELEKWEDGLGNFVKGAPIQAKAVIYHNRLLKELNIKRFKPIAAGEKSKFLYIKKHNPHHIPVVGFSDILPPEFQLEEYVDRKKQFDKGFKAPLTTITDAIGWHTEHVATLDAFFV